jgi:hypothetical protein
VSRSADLAIGSIDQNARIRDQDANHNLGFKFGDFILHSANAPGIRLCLQGDITTSFLSPLGKFRSFNLPTNSSQNLCAIATEFFISLPPMLFCDFNLMSIEFFTCPSESCSPRRQKVFH